MAKRSLSEQLNQLVDALLAYPATAAVPRAGAQTAALARIAADLRGLPREKFKAQLKAELRRRKPMASKPVPVTETVPAQTAVPYLCFKDASAAIELYKKAFGATEVMRLTEPNGKIGHAEIRIGNSRIMMSDEYPDYGALSPESLGGSAVKMNLNVANVDAVVKRALTAGARIIRPVEDQFYGERSGQVADPFGYTWIVSTTKETVSSAEMQRRMDAMFQQPEKEPKQRVDPASKGLLTLTPYLVVQDAPALVEFLQKVFPTEERFRSIGGASGNHIDVRVGDSALMIGGGGGGVAWRGENQPMAFHVYVEDTDAAYKRALEAGGVSIGTPADQPYGERSASVKDAFGNYWYIATSEGETYQPKDTPTVQPYLHPLRAEPVISFLKRAFGAEELARYASSDGVVQHAKMKIGDGRLEMGEAHGNYQPMPSMFYLRVPDVDAVYKRAIQAGGTSIWEPAEQPYGDRVGGVKDPFGNQWYIATQVKDVSA
jgi:PhnB protein